MNKEERESYIRHSIARQIEQYGLEACIRSSIERPLKEGERDSDLFRRKSLANLVDHRISSFAEIRKVFKKWESQGIACILKDPELAAPDEPVIQMLTMFDGAEIWWKKNDPRLKDSGEV